MSRRAGRSGAAGARARRGFTLLEVLAAVLIFSVVATVLIGSSGETIRRVGLSTARLEASELAERELARLEAILATRGLPPEDSEETVDDFTVRVWSEPALGDLGGGGAAPSAGGGLDLAALVSGGFGPLLAAEAPGIDRFLLRYEIRVEWSDGAIDDSVRRTTYAFDWESARQALPDLFDAPAAGLEAGSSPLDDPETLDGDAAALLKQLGGAR